MGNGLAVCRAGDKWSRIKLRYPVGRIRGWWRKRPTAPLEGPAMVKGRGRKVQDHDGSAGEGGLVARANKVLKHLLAADCAELAKEGGFRKDLCAPPAGG